MTAKEYMEQARYLDMQINSKIEQIRNLNDKSYNSLQRYAAQSKQKHFPNGRNRCKNYRP